jgi:hypothetical protein
LLAASQGPHVRVAPYLQHHPARINSAARRSFSPSSAPPLLQSSP